MNFPRPIPYEGAFPVGTKIRIADRPFLELFIKNWKYHHKLSPDQLPYADQEAIVRSVGFYHGGDPIYTLEGIPGMWLEPCLRATGGGTS